MTRGKKNRLVWSDDDIRYLCEHYATMSAEDIARHFGVSAGPITVKARELGLKKPNPHSAILWTAEKLKYLMDNFPTMAACDIADHIGVSDRSVSQKAKALGLQKAESWKKRNYTGRYTKNYVHNIRRDNGRYGEQSQRG